MEELRTRTGQQYAKANNLDPHNWRYRLKRDWIPVKVVMNKQIKWEPRGTFEEKRTKTYYVLKTDVIDFIRKDM